MLRCRVLTLIAIGIFVPAGVKAQSSVTLRATVSETVSISALPNSIGADVVSIGNTVRVTLSGTDSPVIRVPLLVRSNSGFKISAILESKPAVLTQLSVEDVRATGRLVSPQFVNTLDIKSYVDPDISQPLLVASGPRISIGGTLHSPDNALEITLLICWKPELSREPVHLTLAATPESLIP
ncbi:MAG TPA: hypothetical protein VKB05_02945 [Pyrinomonadaceae bacterium]|nr:hypothetical protein [Pyrinomonadaceae bacterium]